MPEETFTEDSIITIADPNIGTEENPRYMAIATTSNKAPEKGKRDLSLPKSSVSKDDEYAACSLSRGPC